MNLLVKKYFEDRGFTFGNKNSDIMPAKINIPENSRLTNQLKSNVYKFQNINKAQTSFYLLTTDLDDFELKEVQQFIWNENQFDLYFALKNDKRKDDFELILYYALTNPKKEQIEIATFIGSDTSTIEKINKWTFNSGVFWLNYSDKLQSIKNKRNLRVDKELVNTLVKLAEKIKDNYKPTIGENRDEVVQALIDRTLFIKFLEDNEILNGWFYKKYFKDEKVNYKTLLQSHNFDGINQLFKLINDIFNNSLFQEPEIKNLNENQVVLDEIFSAISRKDWKTGQLSLFDFQFNVIQIEFISHIYEVFLKPEQRKSGIYYTPSNLAQIIVDEVITGTGKILDPSCGSGMFLVLAFRKLLEYNKIETDDIALIIEHRNNLVKNFIFGIEKLDTAKRIAVFSLYLELLKDISGEKIKAYIKDKLEQIQPNKKLKLFPENFNKNISLDNALNLICPHSTIKFDYIVGNPPFLQFPEKDIEYRTENQFLKDYKISIDDFEIKAKDVIGYRQLSQCFMLRLKEWASPSAKFGFVLNTSNFYNEKSIEFRKFFFSHYTVNKIFELSDVKNILFLSSSETVSIVIFDNNKNANNFFEYLKVNTNYFSESFGTMVLEQDNIIKLNQNDITENIISLRDYLIGNEFDRELSKKIATNNILNNFLLQDKNDSISGLKRPENNSIYEYFKESFKNSTKAKTTELHEKFAHEKYLKSDKTNYFNTPFIQTPDYIKPFFISSYDGFVNEKDINKDNFQRPRNLNIYKGKKILLNRFGKRINAVFTDYNIFFAVYIYGLKLKNENFYRVITAILNSEIINYFILLRYRKRANDNFPNLTVSDIKIIPIPDLSNERIIKKINSICEEFENRTVVYTDEIKRRLNNLIFDLYDLNILERQRIIDYFVEEREVQTTDLGNYKETIYQALELYFENIEIIFEDGKNLPLKRAIVAIVLNNAAKPDLKNILRYYNNETFSENHKDDIICLRERLYAKDCIFIIKDGKYSNWTETKAYEDGREILKSFGLCEK